MKTEDLGTKSGHSRVRGGTTEVFDDFEQEQELPELPDSLLRALVDCRDRQIQKARVAFGNRLAALLRYGEPSHDQGSKQQVEIVRKYYEMFLGLERQLDKDIAAAVRDDPVYPYLQAVKGVGPLMAAKLLAFIDFSRAPTVSALWRFCGYAAIDGKAERPRPGERLHYCRRLKTTCFLLGTQLLRARSPYARIYYKAREQYALERPQWTKGHRHLAAMRKMVKVFLAHLWFVGRTLYGLPTEPPYIIGRDGHSHEYRPEEFGWPAL
jgi:hypothetical protein